MSVLGYDADVRIRVVVGTVAIVAATTSACGALLPAGDDDPPTSPPSADSGSDGNVDGSLLSDGDSFAPVDPTAEPSDASTVDARTTLDGGDAATATGNLWHCVFEPHGPYASLNECEAARSQLCGPATPDALDFAPCTMPGETVSSCGGCNTFKKFYAKTCTCN